MSKRNWAEVMEQVHKIENEHGSVLNTNINSPEIVKLRLLTGAKHINYTGQHDFDEKKLVKLVKKGFNASEISKKIKVSKTVVQYYLHDHELQCIPRFNWKAVGKDGKTYYTDFLHTLGTLVGANSKRTSSKRLKERLLLNGYSMWQIRRQWYKLPDGVNYRTKGLNKWHKKNGVDSFIYKD